MKKIIIILIILLIIAILIAIYFGFIKTKKNTITQVAAENLPLTGILNVEIFDRGLEGGRTLAHNNEWTNWVREKVLKDLDIDVTFVPVNRWSENIDIANLMESGDAPDLCYTYNYDMINDLIDKEGIFDIAPYIDSYLPDFKNLLGADPSFPGKQLIYRDQDPLSLKIYSVCNYRTDIAQRNIFIRKDWLDKLEMPVPKNISQFYKALKAFRDRDPGNVGKDRVVPLGLNQDVRWGLSDFINHFIDLKMSDRDRWIYSIADRVIMMPGYKRGVYEMNKWYKEGLIFKDFQSMTTVEDFIGQIKSGVVGSFCQNWDFIYRIDMNILVDLRKNVPDAEYIPISITNNKEVMDKAGFRIFIPSSSPNKDAALKYLNWLAKPENYQFLQIGNEGVNHKMVNGIPEIITTPPQDPWFMNSPNNIDITIIMNGIELGSDAQNAKAIGLSYGDISPDVISKAYITATTGARGPVIWRAITTVNQYSDNLRKEADELISKAITAMPADFNGVWNNGVKDWLKIGGQEVLDEKNALYPK
jgi:putative aldouronate transport system substrate-binding protein